MQHSQDMKGLAQLTWPQHPASPIQWCCFPSVDRRKCFYPVPFRYTSTCFCIRNYTMSIKNVSN